MGHLPFSEAIRAFHEQKLAGKTPQGIQSIVEDIHLLAWEGPAAY